jgi:hypothetical protein
MEGLWFETSHTRLGCHTNNFTALVPIDSTRTNIRNFKEELRKNGRQRWKVKKRRWRQDTMV